MIIQIDFLRLEEAFEQLKVHELSLQERNSRDEKQALLYSLLTSLRRTMIVMERTWKEKGRIMIVMERRRRSHLTNPRSNAIICKKVGHL